MENSEYDLDRAKWAATILDPELRQQLSRATSSGDSTGEIREAFALLERRIRESAGLEAHHFGKDLIDRAFHPDNGILQPVSPVPAERAGMHHLLIGIFLYYRNPVAHRPIYYSQESFRRIVSQIDHALHLVSQSVELTLDLSSFIGPHEGQVRRRRDYRLDIDGDETIEVVSLLELGAVSQSVNMVPHLAPVILKRINGAFKRIPADWIAGQSIFGPSKVDALHITGPDQFDVVVHWTWGMTQDLVLILRNRNDRYELVRREVPSGMLEPYNGPGERGFIVHPRQLLDFADVDGDGITEMVQTLSFGNSELEGMGYSNQVRDSIEPLVLCRLLKWDAEQERIRQIDERVVARR